MGSSRVDGAADNRSRCSVRGRRRFPAIDQLVHLSRLCIVSASIALSIHSKGGVPGGRPAGTCTVTSVCGSPLWRCRSHRIIPSKLWMMPTHISRDPDPVLHLRVVRQIERIEDICPCSPLFLRPTVA